MELIEIIKNKIREKGPLSFRDFMDLSLYYPKIGYYTSDIEKIGKNGDYLTSPSFTPVFGKLIARQLEEMWVNLGKGEFTILEYGAGKTELSYDILEHIKQNNLQFFDKLHYYILEKSDYSRAHVRPEFKDKVYIIRSISEIKSFNGCVLANEVLDNFPIHLVVMRKELMEVYINFDNGFKELLRPAGEELTTYLDAEKVKLSEGYRTEINLLAANWLKEIEQHMNRGYLITIDYGFPAHELYSDRRRNGTLVCYHKHTVNEQPFQNIGKQDITAHVNFSALQRFGKQLNMVNCGYTSQAMFLRALGFSELITELEREENGFFNKFTYNQKMAFLRQMTIDLGAKIKVMIQGKGLVPVQCKLRGMLYAQELS